MAAIRIAGTEPQSIVDGPGFRYTLFVQGCFQHCPSCQNPQTHDPEGGTLTDTDAIYSEFAADPLLSGMTFSGGEPFLQPAPLLVLAKQIHALGKNVMSYSGYTFEELLEMGEKDAAVLDLLHELDALVDGPFIEELKSGELLYRGSSNQRYLKRADMDALEEAWRRT